MLVSSHKLLGEARKNRTAIGAFNTSNLEITQAIIAAAEKNNSPVIIQTSMKALKYAGYEALSSAIVEYAKNTSVPVVLHLDHGNFETAMKLIEDGKYTSVMFDGSKLSVEENIAQTKTIVEAARKKNISVEAEVGAVGAVGGELDFTDPGVAKKFVEETGCDSLAVAFGNLHGAQTGEEKLDFEVLENIAKEVSAPLVFHGASNLSDEDYRKAISLGVAKINLDTEIRQAFVGAMRKYLTDNPSDIDPRAVLAYARTSAEEVVDRRINVFNNPVS